MVAACGKSESSNPGVGPLTALAFVLIPERADRFQCGKQIASYLRLVPPEESSGNRRRLGLITKKGNALLRFLLAEAAQVSARSIPEWRNKYFRLAMRRGRKIAKLAMAGRVAALLGETPVYNNYPIQSAPSNLYSPVTYASW